MVHGYAAAASDYETLDSQLAAAGFVVAAPDFPRSSRAATTSPSRDIVEQATDVSFVLDQVMSGAAFGFSGSWFTGDTTPALLVLHGTADEMNPYASSESLYDEATGAKMLVAVEGGSHTGPFTTDASVADVGALIAGFLHTYLEGDAAAAAQLRQLGNAGAHGLAP
jgi:esterase/lipase